MAKSVSALRVFAQVVGVVCLLQLGGLVLYLLGSTVVNAWLFSAAVAGVSAVAGVFLVSPAGSVTRITVRWVNYVIAVAVVWTFLSAAFLSVNYFGVERDSLAKEKVLVTGVYTKKRHHMERVGRRSYRQGEPYRVYFIDVDILGEGVKRVEVPYGVYRKVHKGDSAYMKMGRGTLGLTIVEPRSLESIRKPRKKREIPHAIKRRNHKTHEIQN